MLLGLSIRNDDVSQVDLGNPELDPYLSDNIDLGFEYYTGQEGYFGVAAFRKGIEGFTQRQSQNVVVRRSRAVRGDAGLARPAATEAVNARGGPNALRGAASDSECQRSTDDQRS